MNRFGRLGLKCVLLQLVMVFGSASAAQANLAFQGFQNGHHDEGVPVVLLNIKVTGTAGQMYKIRWKLRPGTGMGTTFTSSVRTIGVGGTDAFDFLPSAFIDPFDLDELELIEEPGGNVVAVQKAVWLTTNSLSRFPQEAVPALSSWGLGILVLSFLVLSSVVLYRFRVQGGSLPTA